MRETNSAFEFLNLITMWNVSTLYKKESPWNKLATISTKTWLVDVKLIKMLFNLPPY
jgi:hypothetical protein